MRRDDVPLTDAPAGERPGPPGLVLVFGLAVLGVIIWRLADVLLLALGSVLVAVLLHALAAPMQKRLGWRRPVALTAAVVATTLFSAGALWLFGQQIVVQIDTLTELMPRAWSAVRQQLATTPFGAYVLEDLQRLRQSPGGVVSLGSQLIRGSAGAAAATLIVVFAGLYLAFHPRTYLGGLLRLVPLNLRPRAEAVLLACGDALNRWLTAQLASMLFIGVTVALGLWLAGVPSPVALGALAGLGQLVPVIGPMISSVPGLIIAAAAGPSTFLWSCAIYFGAMQIEANLITPLMLRQMVEAPMAVTLFAVLAMGVLFGPLGVLFATPLVVIAYVFVRMVWVEDVLGDRRPGAL